MRPVELRAGAADAGGDDGGGGGGGGALEVPPTEPRELPPPISTERPLLLLPLDVPPPILPERLLPISTDRPPPPLKSPPRETRAPGSIWRPGGISRWMGVRPSLTVPGATRGA